MKRFKKFVAVLLCAVMASSSFMLQSVVAEHASKETLKKSEGRNVVNFNNDWSFKKGDMKGAELKDYDASSWLYVNLPHAIDHYTSENKEAYLGISTYRKVFDVPSQWEGRKLLLTFEAAMQASDVWINGEKVLRHEGGYTPFVMDLSNLLHFGEKNTITVKVDSRPNASFAPGKTKPDFQYWGGIYGNAFLTVTDPIHVSNVLEANIEAGGGIFITAPAVTKEQATLDVKTHIMNESDANEDVELVQEVYDPNDQLVASAQTKQAIDAQDDFTFAQTLSIDQPALWSVYTPDLYKVKTSVWVDGVKRDEISTKYGIRKVVWQRDGLYVNDERMDVNGTNLHSETFMLGNAVPDNAIYAEVKRVKELGFDAVRMAHYPHVQAFYDACDAYGILVIECVAGWQNFNNTTAFKNSTYEQMRTMVRTHRNNASVVAWEASLNESNYTQEWAKEMNRVTKAEYPQNGDAYAWTAGCIWWNAWDIGLGTPQADLFGTGSAGANGSANQDKPIIIAEYGDWNYGGSNSTTRVTREPQNRWSIGAGDKGMLTQVDNLQEAVNVNRLKGMDWLGLSAYWHYADYAGFDYDMLSNSGVVDVYRIPKFSSYFYQSQRDASIDMSDYGIETGPMVYIANTWANDASPEVRIFSNCDTVELFLNGESLGEAGHDDMIYGPHGDGNHRDHPMTGKGKDISAEGLKNAPITFQLDAFEEGELKAIGKINGEEKAITIRRTPKAAQAIDLRKENDVPLRLDGSDVKLIWIDVIDENKTIVNTNQSDVQLQVEGPGMIIGEKTVTMRGGQLGVWVRSKRGVGDVTLTASANGLISNTVTIETQHVDGLPEVPVGGDADETEYVEPVVPENLFLGKPAIAKTEQAAEKAVYANDGNENTKWCETGTGAPLWNNALPQWWQVDLGDMYRLSEIKLSLETSNAIYQYTISVSNDPDVWGEEQIVVDRRNNSDDTNTDHMLQATGRYVRIEITGTPLDANGKAEWAVLREVYGYGTSANIALHKPVSASSENTFGNTVEFAKWANDGDTTTKWCAKGGAGTSNHWWQVDLKDTYKLSDVDIMFEMTNAGYKFDLQGSLDGVNFTSIQDFRKGDGIGQNVRIETDYVVRYLRIYDITTKNMATQWPCIFEVSAHGEIVDYTLQSTTREKPATASSSRDNSQPSYGNNGVPNYYWYPETLQDEWWMVDTQGFYDLDNIQLTWNENEIHRYAIEISTDGEHWTNVVDKRNNRNEEIRTFDNVKGLARFIRVQLPKTREKAQGFGLFDAYAPKATPREVTHIQVPNAIEAPLHTAFDALPLPQEVSITLKGGIAATLPIKWSQESYDADLAQDQILKGSIQVLDGVVLEDTSIEMNVMRSETKPSDLVKAILLSAVQKAEKVDLNFVAPSVIELLNIRLAQAKVVLNNPAATTQMYLDAWLGLANIMHYLDFKADKRDLEILVQECKKINIDEYTIGVEEFRAALKNAENVLADAGVLQESITNAYQRLELARNALVKNEVNKALLRYVYDSIVQAVGNGDAYAKDTQAWLDFTTALETAYQLLHDESATQVAINQAFQALTNAYENIRLLPDEALLEALQNFINTLENIDITRFHAGQVRFIKQTKARALQILNDPSQSSTVDKVSLLQDIDEIMQLLEGVRDEVKDPTITTPLQPATTQETSTPQQIIAVKGTTKTGDRVQLASMLLLFAVSGCMIGFMKKRRLNR